MYENLRVTVLADRAISVSLPDGRRFSQDFQFSFEWDSSASERITATERIVLRPPIFTEDEPSNISVSGGLMQVIEYLGISELSQNEQTIPVPLGEPLGVGCPIRFRIVDPEAIMLPNSNKAALSIRFSLMPYNKTVIDVETCALDENIIAVTEEKPSLPPVAQCYLNLENISGFMSNFGLSVPKLPNLYYLPEVNEKNRKIALQVVLPPNEDRNVAYAEIIWDPVSDECEVTLPSNLQETDIANLDILLTKLESPNWISF